MYVICHRAFNGVTFPSREDAVITAFACGLGPWRVALNLRK
jgi:hypothetical protein